MRRAFAAVKTLGSFQRFSSEVKPTIKEVSPRLQALREKLKINHPAGLIAQPSHVFAVSAAGKDFLANVQSNHLNIKYSRGGNEGEGYLGVKEAISKIADKYYADEERKLLLERSKEIEERMRVKVSESYLYHALNIPKTAKEPNPILKIVLPDSQEIADLSGETDPSNQNRYSPLPGLLHKYEMLLAFVSINCSAHCRYCYRLDLFSGVSSKSKADMQVIAAYIKSFNELIEDATKQHGKWNEKLGLWIHKETNEPLIPIREILFSGGDPMTLPNATIARYIALMAEAGLSTIRIGTKELVFNPKRFDTNFWKMMDLFHETYPEVRVEFIGHYSHPYELVEAEVDENGSYIYDARHHYKIREDIRTPLNELAKRSAWIGHHNQFPIIAGINDSPDILRLLIYQTHRLGIVMHNIYACREIPGNVHFRGHNTIEEQYKLVANAKVVLSGLKNNGRLIMSTEYGKVEVCGIEEGAVFLKLNRFANLHQPEHSMIKVDLSKLPEGQKFYWLTDEAIEAAVSKDGQKSLRAITNEDDSLIKKFKQIAADKSRRTDEIKSEECESKFRRKDSVTIEVVTRKGSQLIEIALGDKKLTLATKLAEEGYVEAACKEQMSCSTCVGKVESDVTLTEATEDEKDLVDSAIAPDSTMKPEDVEKLRATCQITLRRGAKYKFTNVEKLDDKARS